MSFPFSLGGILLGGDVQPVHEQKRQAKTFVFFVCY